MNHDLEVKPTNDGTFSSRGNVLHVHRMENGKRKEVSSRWRGEEKYGTCNAIDYDAN